MPERLAQLFLFCRGIPLILVQQAFPVTCLVTLAHCAWARARRWLCVNAGVAIGCVRAHRNACGVPSVGLASPRGAEAAASMLFFSELFSYQVSV